MSHKKYFYGEGDSLGIVRPLPFSSFKTLVDQKINLATTVNISKEEFLALPKQERQVAKRVQYLVPATFRGENNKRRMENCGRCNLLFLDIDEGENEEYPARPYVNDPDLLTKQLAPFNFAAYTTVSSTKEQPRMRIVIDAENIGVREFKKAVLFIAERIGLSQVTKESLLPHQPMYLPTLFLGQEDSDHPLLACRTDGEPLTEKVFKEFEPSLGSNAQFIQTEWHEDTTGSALDFLRPAVDGITLEVAEEALGNIDPDIPYAQWLEIAAALRHQFPRELATQAYQLFDTWSSLGTKYAGGEDTLAKWNSLRPNPQDRVPVTIRSLLRIAMEQGWSSNKTKDMCFQSTLRWLENARLHTDLISEGLGRILTTPLIGHAEEEALLNAVVQLAKNKFKMKISISTLRKDMKRLKQDLDNKAKKPDDEVKIPRWARGICYVSRTNEFFRHSNMERFSPESLDNVYSRMLMGEEGDEDAVENCRPGVLPRNFLLNKVQIPAVYDYIYDPRKPGDTFVTQYNRPYVNTYVPTYPDPIPEGVEYVERMVRKHMENLIGEERYRKILMDYLAHQIQFPGHKIRWAVLLQGAEGCGKSFVSELVGAALGAGHMRPIDLTAVKSGYNDWAYGAQLISIEEIRVAGANRHEIMNMLKPLITNDTINVNQRYRDSRPVDNVTNYILYTNHHDALVLSKADRRYFVLKSAIQTKQQVLDLGEEYFEELFQMLQTHAPQVRYFFENWHISTRFKSDGHAPETHYLRQLIRDSASEAATAVRDVIDEGGYALCKHDLLSSTALMSALEMQQFNCTKQHLAAVLRDECYENLGRMTLNGQRHIVWRSLECETDISRIKDIMERRLKGQDDMSDEELETLL